MFGTTFSPNCIQEARTDMISISNGMNYGSLYSQVQVVV